MPASSNSQTSDTHIFLLNRHSLPGYPYPHTFNLFLPFLNLLFCASQILRFYPYQLAVPRPFFSGKFNDLHSQSSPVYWNRLCRSFNLTFKGGSTWFFRNKTPISFWDSGFFIQKYPSFEIQRAFGLFDGDAFNGMRVDHGGSDIAVP